ncbi:SAM-dependent methyltransferase [Streptomyces sp. NPDC059506]|uniref:SAM-dependent methyltransferase n=1 Tax=Streptomyces TaxID=1883 RepID=UPI000CA696B2|nr:MULTISPECIES: SAM-dependent methyltransferase [unclassified Streptomyces]MCZ2528067.1 SAM-dependent methyltransferase [Streptomyces sp. HB2AG]PLW73778.1 methyltransferase [Streptomyces sp. DJ]QMV24315.1 SAM-dependent methyltransferase [Streptomyces sp. SCUT-3]
MTDEQEWMRVDPDAPAREPVDLRTDRPHSARMYDCYLGGKTNYPADREAVGRVLAANPTVIIAARANRAWMNRVVRYLAEHEGVRQFLDIGTGIPTSPNLHEIVQGVAPEARVVYADNDPIVLAHAQALLRSTPEGRTAYLDADVRDPRRILTAPELLRTLDLDRPVALSMAALLHFVPDDQGAQDIVKTLVDALAPGSFLVLSHATGDFAPEEWARTVETYRASGTDAQVRSREEVARFFDGLELLEPGVVMPHQWRLDVDASPLVLQDAEVSGWVGVARKP